MITSRIDTSGMDEVLRKLSSATSRTMRDVTLSESQSVLQTCLDRTKLTPRSVIDYKIQQRFHQYSSGKYGKKAISSFPKISIAPKKDRTWYVEQGPKFFLAAGEKDGHQQHLPDSIWAEYQQAESERKSKLRASVIDHLSRQGLPKQTWQHLGELLGLNLKAGQNVINATVKGHQIQVEDALIKEATSFFQVVCSTQSIAAARKGAARILSTVLSGRVKYFRTNLEKGVFDSLKQIERAYPNLLKVNR
jgi:hypothetical protein